MVVIDRRANKKPIKKNNDMKHNLYIAALFVLAAIVTIGLCANPSEDLSLLEWLVIFSLTKGAAFLAGWAMYKILNSKLS